MLGGVNMNSLINKQHLDTKELQMLQSEMDKRKKSTTTTWLLWFFLGGIGGHRYYLGRTGSGIAMTLTLGGLCIWTLIDLFLISGMIRSANEEIESNILADLNLLKNAKSNTEAAAASN